MGDVLVQNRLLGTDPSYLGRHRVHLSGLCWDVFNFGLKDEMEMALGLLGNRTNVSVLHVVAEGDS